MWLDKRYLGTYKMFCDKYDYEVRLGLSYTINDNILRKSEEYYELNWRLVEGL